MLFISPFYLASYLFTWLGPLFAYFRSEPDPFLFARVPADAVAFPNRFVAVRYPTLFSVSLISHISVGANLVRRAVV